MILRQSQMKVITAVANTTATTSSLGIIFGRLHGKTVLRLATGAD